MIERSFQAMGGTVEVQLVDGGEAVAQGISSLFSAYEEQLSRFLPWSELSQLNAAQVRPFTASETLFDVVSQSLAWAMATDGVFDPTMLNALESFGYDRTFDLIRETRTGRGPLVGEMNCGWAAIRLDPATREITLPVGARIDLGGIGKGYTVDHAISALGPVANAMVNASGDLYAAGAGPEGSGWLIGVQDPTAPDDDVAQLRVRDRGVATSGSTHRNWPDGVGGRYHHLIDARERRCAISDVLTVTVVAQTATAADVLAKTAFLLGSGEGLETVERFGAAALAVTSNGSVLSTSSLKEYAA